MKLTVKFVLIALSAWVLLMFLALATAGAFGFANLHRTVLDIEATAAAVRRQMDADMMHDAVRSDVLSALIAAQRGDETALTTIANDLREHVARMRSNVDQNIAANLDAEVGELARATRDVLERYAASAQAIVEASRARRPVEAQLAIFNQDFEALESSMELLADRIDALAEHSLQSAGTVYKRGIAGLLLGGTIAFVLSAFGCWLTFRRTVPPLVKFVGIADQVRTSGNLTLRVGYTAEDEIGRTAQAFDQLLDHLQQLVADVRTSGERIRNNGMELLDVATESAQTSQRQSEAAAAMAATVEELSANIQRMSDRAKDVAELTGRSNGLSAEGARITDESAAAIEVIAGSVQTSASAIRTLDDNAGVISGLISVIREIADQTNLLALNAAIEAARAGEQGRGFAVVADEVRKLAERTTNSSQEIVTIVSRIQSSARDSAVAMDQGVTQVETGVSIARNAGERIRQVAHLAADAASQMQDISHALTEQNHAGQEIAERVEQVARAADRNHHGAAQAAERARALAGEAEHLHELVARFGV